MSLKAQAIHGVKWTTLSTVVTTLMQLLQLAVLARFLSPSDFGLMALVMVVIGFSQAFMDMGISNAIIHRQEISHVQLSSLYWLNIASGIVLFGIVVLVSPWIALFYHEPRLTELVMLMGISFVFVAIGNQHRTLCQKELMFNTMAKVEIFTVMVSTSVAIFMAINGYGVYSMVWGALINAALSSLLFLGIGLKTHRPSFVYRYSELSGFLSFGMYQMGEKTINYFNSQIDILLIGKLLGTEALGIYSIAKQLVMRPAQLINPTITRVTFPMMAKVQNDIPALKKMYLKTIGYLAWINFPIYMLLALLAPWLVPLLFGAQWNEAIMIVQILSLYAAFRSTGNPIGSLMLARGRANLGFYWNLGLFFFVPIGIYISSHWGLIGVSWGLVIIMITLMIPNWYFLVRPLCGAGFIEYFKCMIPNLSIVINYFSNRKV